MNADTARVNVFKTSDPVFKDPLDIFGVELGQRRNFRLWTEMPRDLDGTIELEAPKPLQCPRSLSDGKIPDALQEQGFVEVRGRCVHVPDGLFTFDSRHVISSRSYM